MRYLILDARCIADLQGEVNAYIEQGWLPSGGVSETQDDDGRIYLQAITLAQPVATVGSSLASQCIADEFKPKDQQRWP